MRISGGQLKGRKVAVRKAFSSRGAEDELRPTSAKVREAMFDILRDKIQKAVFLDLYAGTGAVGLEALSRGALQVMLIEKNAVRARAIKDFIRENRAEDRAKIYREKAEYFLRRAFVSGAQFDIIFADPPYESDEYSKVFRFLNEYNVLREGASFVLEHSSRFVLPGITEPLVFVRSYKYGDTMLTLYRKES